jgi:hypothetical protein
MSQNMQTMQELANMLIEIAKMYDAVITIDLRPRQPLSMGNYEMVADVRQSRSVVKQAEGRAA